MTLSFVASPDRRALTALQTASAKWTRSTSSLSSWPRSSILVTARMVPKPSIVESPSRTLVTSNTVFPSLFELGVVLEELGSIEEDVLGWLDGRDLSEAPHVQVVGMPGHLALIGEEDAGTSAVLHLLFINHLLAPLRI